MFLKLTFVLSLIISQSVLIRCEPDRLDETIGDEKKPEPEVRKLANTKPGNRDGDIWSMVGSMRQGSSGKGRVEAVSSTFSKSLQLEWKIELDQAGNYRLNWCANASRNEILFALDIDLVKSGFRIGHDIFAVGFSERGEFASSDFCLIWFDLSHRIHLQDARTSANNTMELVDSRGSVCKLLNHHHSSQPDRESPTLKVEIDYEDDEVKLEAESREPSEQAREKLEIIFTRPLEVCHHRPSSYYAIDNGTTHLLWFALRGPLLELDGLNLTDALGGSVGHNELSKEERAGLRRVQMIAGQSDRKRSEPSSRVFEVRVAQSEIPARETTYMCSLFRLPAKFETRRYHITSYEAAIEPGNEHVVHHMELFNCANLEETERNQLAQLAASGWAGECGSGARPAVTQKCKRVILAWAMGARPLVYPAQVGQSIGGRGYSPFVLLEVHYNNVHLQTGLHDSSGLRFHYSPKLRPFDAGVLEVGLEYSDKNSIPAGMLVPLSGHCVSECTRAAMSAGEKRATWAWNHQRRHRHGRQHLSRPEEGVENGELNKRERETKEEEEGEGELQPGIYIFAAQMHTHLTGVASWTEHVRGGQLLGELQRDDHYSPHFQEIRLLPEPVHLAPGDALIHYCLYDTRSRSNITLGGFATTDEMCVTYLHYYPRIDLEVCKSSVDSEALSRYFANLARDEAQQSTPLAELMASKKADNNTEHGHWPKLKTISENYRSIDWSARRSRELVAFYDSAPLSVQCNRSDGRRWPGEWNGLEPTHFFQLNHNFSEQVGPTDAVQENDGAVDQETPFSATTKRKGAHELVQYRGVGGLARRRARCKSTGRRMPFE